MAIKLRDRKLVKKHPAVKIKKLIALLLKKNLITKEEAKEING